MTRMPLQRTPEWYAARREGITATDIPAILGLSRYKSEGDVAREKLTGETIETTAAQERRFRLGRTLEDAIAAEDVVEHGIPVERVRRLRRSKTIPWALASLDGVRVGEPKTVVEIKTSTSPRWDDGLPQDVEAQVRWQMGVTGYPRGHVVALRYGRDIVCHDVEHDEATWQQLVEIAEDFRSRLAAGGPFAESRASGRRAWPRDDGSEVTADDEVREAVETLFAVRGSLSRLGETEDALIAAIQARMGPASVMIGPGWRITWKAGKERSVPDYKTIAKDLREYALERGGDPGTIDVIESLHTETREGSRPFLLREEKD